MSPCWKRWAIPITFELRYLNGKLAVPVLSALLRDGHAYLWIVETPFPGKDELKEADTSPFDQRLFRRQYPPPHSGARRITCCRRRAGKT